MWVSLGEGTAVSAAEKNWAPEDEDPTRVLYHKLIQSLTFSENGCASLATLKGVSGPCSKEKEGGLEH